jgi:hypothetical protein
MNPKTGEGAFHYVMFGFFGALTILVISLAIPSIIPAQATGVRL